MKSMKNEITTAQPRLYSLKQAAALLGISPWTLRVWAYRGRVESAKLGRLLMIPSQEIDRVVREATRPRLESKQ